ncbi:MAG: bifunctional 5,10-methylenetetrahydrofolate dehydrogenase/5,10-methenyltetrahydrofolate cyclohydrolase [Thermoproteota archaeon]|nr:bifunctional 5,10-methylenetetrahydrofolate dehydrogenase/5,10-methenyltetrahydrofolate cyclohydrolase [Thermoproteota archaeon]
MAGQKIDGIEVSNEVKEILKRAVQKLKSEGLQPCLATILVGNDPASMTYVRNKHKACESVGIKTKDYNLSNTASQEELDKIIDDLNNDRGVHGILVQLPLPRQLNEFTTISRILPLKDVDGLTPQNVGLLSMGKSILKACTPSGIMEMFYYYKINLEGKNIVMINRSNLIGKPLYNLLLQNNATVITCHSKTKNLKEYCQNADIIITAVGDRTKFKLTSDMIKQGAIVIDVAISRHNGKLVGDTDYDDIIQRASWATPVPGGVGPMTVAMLLKNTVTAASLNKEIVG